MILVLARKIFNIYVDIEPIVGLMSRVLPVLDNGTRPNLIQKSKIPSGIETVESFGPTQYTSDTNSRPLCTVGTMKMPLRPRCFVAAAEFMVSEKLAILFIQGADFCGRFVEAIDPQKKMVDFSEVPTVRQFSAR